MSPKLRAAVAEALALFELRAELTAIKAQLAVLKPQSEAADDLTRRALEVCELVDAIDEADSANRH